MCMGGNAETPPFFSFSSMPCQSGPEAASMRDGYLLSFNERSLAIFLLRIFTAPCPLALGHPDVVDHAVTTGILCRVEL